MTKYSIRFFVLIIALTLSAYACSGGASGAKKAVEEYVNALKKGDYDTLYALNTTTQKKVALIYRRNASDENTRQYLDENFSQYKNAFNATETGAQLSRAVWAEKGLFPAGAKHAILDVTTEKDEASPSQRVNRRVVATAKISVEYTDKASAPLFGTAKAKKLISKAVVIRGEDVIKGLPSKVKTRDWLVQSFSVVRGSVEFFD